MVRSSSTPVISTWCANRSCRADLDPQTPGLDIQRACGTGLEAAILVANKIALGQIDAGIACGVDTVSDPPVVLPKSFGELLLRSYRGRNLGQRLAPWLKLRPHDLKPILPAVVEPRTGLSMGQSCELMAKTWKISRDRAGPGRGRKPPQGRGRLEGGLLR